MQLHVLQQSFVKELVDAGEEVLQLRENQLGQSGVTEELVLPRAVQEVNVEQKLQVHTLLLVGTLDHPVLQLPLGEYYLHLLAQLSVVGQEEHQEFHELPGLVIDVV